MISKLNFKIFHYLVSTIAMVGVLLFISIGCTSNSQIKASPLRSDSAVVAEVNVYIEYSSPSVKKRKIFGDGNDYLVPYGEVWRTGANNATFISVGKHINVDTFRLDSGRYSIFTIPDKEEWTVLFNREWNQWGSYDYKDSLDVIQLKVVPRIESRSQEQMVFYFAEDSLKFGWDKIRWAIPLFIRN